MSYDIHYNTDGTYCMSQNKERHAKKIGWIFIFAIMGIVGYYLLSQAEILPISVLLPGASEETAMAIQNMLEDIMAGRPVMDAVKAFCAQVMEYAK